MKNRIYILLLMAFTVINAMSWTGMEMPKLHVEGRWLVDEEGNHVNLHGFGQTYSPWFNERGSKWSNYDVDACLKYNKKNIDEMMKAGWKVNFLRLHMDPYWSNTPACRRLARVISRRLTSIDSGNIFRKYSPYG